MFRRTFLGLAVAAATALGLAGQVAAEDKFIVVQSTTSTQNSGLFFHLLPIFTEKTGIEVRVVAVGTGLEVHARTERIAVGGENRAHQVVVLIEPAPGLVHAE